MGHRRRDLLHPGCARFGLRLAIIDAIYSGADAPLSHEFTGLGDTAFFRLRSTDQPTSDPWADNFDGDYLSNADEIRLFGTDPLVFDSDGDGLGDGYAIPGWVRTEVWEDIPDKQVTALTSDPGFPHAPDSAFWLQKLESPRDWAETYGTRTRGYILPTESGDYRFYLTADDQAEFWLSPDQHAFNKTRLIGPAGGSWNNWERKPEQISAPVSLQAGTRHYFEILHKERYGGDHFQIAWARSGDTPAVISADYLLSWQPDPDDADDDALPDAWEQANGLDPADNGATGTTEGGFGDFDADGLNNYREFKLGTNPVLADTDGDGHNDWVEAGYFGTSATDALDQPALAINQSWQARAIGTPVSPVAYDEGADKLHLLAAGSGVDLRTADSTGFFYQTVTGDFSVTISYDQADQQPGQVKAGGAAALSLMARESLDADSRYVGARIRRALSAFNLGVRSETGGESFLQENLSSTASYDRTWVRLERKGNYTDENAKRS